MKREVNIPTDLSEINLSRYQRFMEKENPNELDMISALMNIDPQLVAKMKHSSVSEIASDLGELFRNTPEFVQTFKIGTTEYGFIPSLDDISFGENADLVEYIQDWKTMHKAMAVMYRPITKKVKQKGTVKYLIEEYNGTAETADIMKSAPVSAALGANVFFWNLTNELLKATQKYMEEEMDKQQKQGNHLDENGEAIANSLNSLRETLGDLTKFPSHPSIVV